MPPGGEGAPLLPPGHAAGGLSHRSYSAPLGLLHEGGAGVRMPAGARARLVELNYGSLPPAPGEEEEEEAGAYHAVFVEYFAWRRARVCRRRRAVAVLTRVFTRCIRSCWRPVWAACCSDTTGAWCCASRAREQLTFSLPPPADARRRSSNIAVALPLIGRSFGSVASSTVLKEAIVSITTLGSALGGLLGGAASDAYGRKAVIVASDLLFIANAVALGAARSPAQLVVGRGVVGIAIGVTRCACKPTDAASRHFQHFSRHLKIITSHSSAPRSIVSPVYIAEVSPKSVRAMLVALYSLQIGAGLVLSFVGGFALTLSSSQSSWRVILAAPAALAVLQLSALCLLPESPRWLASSGRLAEAEAVARTLVLPPGAAPAAAAVGEGDEVLAELREVFREGRCSGAGAFSSRPAGRIGGGIGGGGGGGGGLGRAAAAAAAAGGLAAPPASARALLSTRPVAAQLCIGVGLSCLHSLAGARTILYYSLEARSVFFSHNSIFLCITHHSRRALRPRLWPWRGSSPSLPSCRRCSRWAVSARLAYSSASF